MHKRIKVSVIIPFYNGAKWLEEAIDSVLDQTFKDYEVIVINDGSKEDIEYIKIKYKDLITIIDKENGGPSTARNEGIKLANGKYVAFLDSDDMWHRDKLEIQIKCMEEQNAIWSQTMLHYFGENIEDKIIDTSIYNGYVFPRCISSFKIQTSSIVVKKDVMIENNIMFPIDKRYGQDTYVWLELAKRYPILAIKHPYTKFRIRKNNAGFRAHVQLIARADMWKDIKNNRTSVCIKEIPLNMRINYELCIIASNILRLMKKIGIKNERILEVISKFIYLPMWITFKII